MKNLSLAVFCSLLVGKAAIAQIVPDATLPIDSLITSDGKTIEINGGTTAGSNLFHSFESFSLPTGSEAFFNNIPTVENIFTRVTGGSISNIDGLIRANGTANLFLLNPNGIVFGANASLDLGGSFLATTADSIRFTDNVQFSANSPDASPLVTVETPVGLGFSSIGHGTIQILGTGHQLVRPRPGVAPFVGVGISQGLRVEPGKTLALIGRGVYLDGGVLSAQDGNIILGSVDKGNLNLISEDRGWNLDYDSSTSFSDVELSERSLLEVFGSTPGLLEVQGKNLSLTEGSVLTVQNQGIEKEGSLEVAVTGSLLLEGASVNNKRLVRSSIISEAVGLGQGSDVTIFAKNLRLEGGGGIRTGTYSLAQGGTLKVDASEKIQIRGAFVQENIPIARQSAIITTSTSFGSGGNLVLSARQIDVENGGGIGTNTYGFSPGGNLTINASDGIRVAGFFLDSSATNSFFSSDTNISNISSFTFGVGKGGNISLFSPQLIIEGGAGVAAVTIIGEGRGGNVSIEADSVKLAGRAQTLTPSTLASVTYGRGDAGNLTLDTSMLTVRQGAGVATSTFSSGDAGRLEIKADTVTVRGIDADSATPSTISSSAPVLTEVEQIVFGASPIPTGSSGDLTVITDRLIIDQGATVSVEQQGEGNAGTLQISANSIALNNQGAITAATASGDGGNISLDAEDLRLRNNSKITATAGGTGDGGNITIDTNTLVALENSDITAKAVRGRGGNIQINTQGFFLSPDSEINATSELGLDGTVEINTLEQVENSLETIKVNLFSTEEVVRGSCLDRNRKEGRFAIAGRGGLPVPPDSGVYQWEILSAAQPIPNQPTSSQSESSQPTPQSSSHLPIVEAQGLVVTTNGRILLAAQPGEPQSPEALTCNESSQS